MTTNDSTPPSTELEDSGEFVRLPGLFVPREIGPALVPGSNLRLLASGQADDGTPLFAILVRTVAGEDAVAMARAHQQETARRASAAGATSAAASVGRSAERRSRGELKARYLDEHLCLKCNHHTVCRMASALDSTLLVTISSCLAFVPADPDEAVICQLVTIPPVPR